MSTSNNEEVQSMEFFLKNTHLSYTCFFPIVGIKSMFRAMRAMWEALLLMLISVFSKTIGAKPIYRFRVPGPTDNCYCLSWRVAVEAYNVRAWRTVPIQCVRYVENYMLGDQYQQDVQMVVDQISFYLKEVIPDSDGKDAWILDIDDTCLSNIMYYRRKRFGGDPYDPAAFKMWVQNRSCAAIPAILQLFTKLNSVGFKVFLLSGRDEETLGTFTIENLHSQGFMGYERLILRGEEYRGQSAIAFKSVIRKQLIAEGFRIRGNVGDQWSDLTGDCPGDRTFKLPNPMYFVP